MDLDADMAQAMLLAVLKESEDAYLLSDADGRIVQANPACAMYLSPQAPWAPISMDRLVHPEDAAAWHRLLDSAVAGEETELRIATSLRVWRPIRLRMTHSAAGSRLIRLLDPVRERSSRESLREYAHIKSALDESFPVSMSDAAGQILHVNELFCRISGYGRAELLGNNHRILNSGLHRTEFFLEMWQAIASGRTWRGEVRNRRKDGGLYWVDMVVHPIRSLDGSWQRFIAISIPIDERKRFEEELRQARDQAREAAELKGQFLSVMSHEIRTPLNAVLGMAHLLERGEALPAQRRNLQVLRTSAQALMHLVNDVLDHSKIEAGRLEMEAVPFRLRPLLEGIHAGLGPAVALKDAPLELSLAVDPSVPDRLVGDPTRLGQILSNLLSNAVKFTAQGFVRTRIELLSARPGKATLRFSVEDSGIGIAPEHRQRIFEAFVQAQASTTRRFGGTGLGLSITRSLLELMGGSIRLESREGEGSRFWFELELATSEPLAPPPSTAAPRSLEGLRVLLVEDNEFNVLVAGQFLSEWGVDWDSVGNGRLAVEAVPREPWDLVLMDLQMPEMDGCEATARIRAFDRTTPILALTASSEAPLRERAMATGMDGFVTKPIDPDDLRDKIGRFTRRAGEPDRIADLASP